MEDDDAAAEALTAAEYGDGLPFATDDDAIELPSRPPTFPYTRRLFLQALEMAVQSAGARRFTAETSKAIDNEDDDEETRTNRLRRRNLRAPTPDTSFDDICQYVARLYGVNLYVVRVSMNNQAIHYAPFSEDLAATFPIANGIVLSVEEKDIAVLNTKPDNVVFPTYDPTLSHNNQQRLEEQRTYQQQRGLSDLRDRVGGGQLRWSLYDTNNEDVEEEEGEEMTAEQDSIRDDQLISGSYGWYYDVDKKDFCRTGNLQPNITVTDIFDAPYYLNPPNVLPQGYLSGGSGGRNFVSEDVHYDMYVLCPDTAASVTAPPHMQPAYVVGYTADGLVRFPQCKLYRDRGQKWPSMLFIKDGIGLAGVTKVIEIFILTSNFMPIISFDLHEELFTFASRITPYNRVRLINRPTMQTMRDCVKADVRERFPGLSVHGVDQGECVYATTNAPCTVFTVNYMVDNWGLKDEVISMSRSCLALTLRVLEDSLAFLQTRIPRRRSIIYTVCRQFFVFLYKIGYDQKLCSASRLNDAFVMYQNIKKINRQGVEQGGTFQIDMSPFLALPAAVEQTAAEEEEQHTPLRTSNILKFIKWRERKSLIKYIINPELHC